jgi:hypothetical protein
MCREPREWVDHRKRHNISIEPLPRKRFKVKGEQSVQPSVPVDKDITTLTSSSKEYAILNDYFTGMRRKEKPNYAVEKVTSINVIEKSKTYIVFTNSKKCPNLLPTKEGGPRAHGNRCIYFVVKSSGFTIRCSCKCSTTENRARGSCAEWKGKHYDLPPPLQRLFEDVYVAKRIESNLWDRSVNSTSIEDRAAAGRKLREEWDKELVAMLAEDKILTGINK